MLVTHLLSFLALAVVAARGATITPRAVSLVDIDGRPIGLGPRATIDDKPTTTTTTVDAPVRHRRRRESHHARAPNPSLLPPVTGTLTVTRADNGAFVGYVSDQFVSPSTSRFGITANLADALVVTFQPTVNPTIPLELQTINGPDPSHTLLGFVVGPADTSNDLSAGSFNYLLLTEVNHTPALSPPAAVGNSYDSGDSESTIWMYDTVTSHLTAQWINTDGSQPATILWYLPSANGLVATGDTSAFSASFPGGYAIVITVT